MDFVLAKVKRARKDPIVKVLSDKTLYDTIQIDRAASVPYNPDHNLDEDSWFMIPSFKTQAFCIDLLKTPFDSTRYKELKKEQFTKISLICCIQDGNYYFQKITPSLLLRKKILIFGEVAELEDNQLRLVINSAPDAIYSPAQDILIFRSLATISSIFPGIDELYKEATQEEVEQFLEESFISLSNNFEASKVSSPNRKRIALALATLAALPQQEHEAMVSYIDEYCEGQIAYDEDTSAFDIGSDVQLKLLIYGIEQRFYTTPFGKEKRLANSVQAIL